MSSLSCRSCGATLNTIFCDLGMSPPSNSFLKAEQTQQMEPFYPLRVFACDECLLVQLPQYESADKIFSDYIYFSSYSKSWLEHARCYVEKIVHRLNLSKKNTVVEIASNDGYLLQYFKNYDIPAFGIEPAANVAEVARAKGIETIVEFFGLTTARDIVDRRGRADLIVGNNVLAHVPDINDFVSGLAALLATAGTITMEFPHLLHLIAETQFDTVYHEHFSYLSLFAAERVFAKAGLAIYDVEELPTHGGSMRVMLVRRKSGQMSPHFASWRALPGLTVLRPTLGLRKR
jgi:2-polyprenyl-3-methyl-5-hydroxy-6-metoxy-1,4-benzoquinol methylase